MGSVPERKQSLKLMMAGIVIGITAMLPGISGALMCVLFGIYDRLIRDLALLRYWLMADRWFFIPLVVGVLIGTFVSAKVLNAAIGEYPAECMMFFDGLILGQILLFYNTAGNGTGVRDVPCNSLIAFIVGVLVMCSVIAADMLRISGEDVVLSHDLGGLVVMIAVGIVIAVSALVPGISHSTVLIVFGLFGMFTAAISDLDGLFLGGLFLGALAGMLLFPKAIHYALKNHHAAMMSLILGLIVGSFVSILLSASVKMADGMHIAASIMMFVIGLAVSVWSMRVSEKSAL